MGEFAQGEGWPGVDLEMGREWVTGVGWEVGEAKVDGFG